MGTERLFTLVIAWFGCELGLTAAAPPHKKAPVPQILSAWAGGGGIKYSFY